MFSPLRLFIQSLNSETKQDIIKRIGKSYYTGRGSFQVNVQTIVDYLHRNDFRPPYTEEHLNEFINYLLEPQYEEYFEERMPQQEDNDNEIEQLERLRDEINERINELQRQQLEHPTPTHEPQQPAPTNEPEPIINEDKINSLINSLYEKPFGTDINLKDLSIDEGEKLAPLLKEWFNEKIKSQRLNTKIGIKLTVNGESIYWPVNNEHVLKKLEQMFNGDFSFSADELPTLRSDDDTQINITWIDNIRFTELKEIHKKAGERSHKPSAFFEYRLKHEFNEFEEILSKYQIFTHLDNDNHNGSRKELKYNCLIYALSSKISDVDTLAKMSNYFIGISHIPSHMLTDFCKTFNINIVLYTYDEKGNIRKMNDKNGSKYGDKNASETFTTHSPSLQLRSFAACLFGLVCPRIHDAEQLGERIIMGNIQFAPS